MLLLLLFANIPEGRDSFGKLPTGNEIIIKRKAIRIISLTNFNAQFFIQ
jgi:hypothetical protein